MKREGGIPHVPPAMALHRNRLDAKMLPVPHPPSQLPLGQGGVAFLSPPSKSLPSGWGQPILTLRMATGFIE